MAVACLEPARVRRYHPDAMPTVRARPRPVDRPVDTRSHRALAIGIILAGGILQHVLATTPAEPQPTPLTLAAPANPAAAASVSRSPAHPAAATGRTPAHPATARATEVHPAAVRPRAVLLAQRVMPPRPDARRPVAHRSATPGLRRALTSPHAQRLSPLLPPPGPAGDARRIAMQPNPQGQILHLPSVSVAAIRAALRAAGSPALDGIYADGKDAAEYIWDSGRVLAVDPAVVLAIFHHESVFGTQGMARLTNSVGNIRPLPGQPTLDGYRLYRSWEEGIDDCFRLLRSYARHGATTIPQAIPVWAPPSDNNDDSAYIASVLDTMGALYAASKA